MDGKKMTSAAIEMRRLVRLAASPAIPGEKVIHAIARSARRLGFERGRTFGFWYGKVSKPSADELETARRVATERATDAEHLRAEFQRGLDILARLEARLIAIDPDFHGPEISALRQQRERAAGPGSSEG